MRARKSRPNKQTNKMRKSRRWRRGRVVDEFAFFKDARLGYAGEVWGVRKVGLKRRGERKEMCGGTRK